MKTKLCIAGLLMGAGLLTTASAQVDVGRQEYLWHCATCHGPMGRGDGELRKFLTTKPSDLTTISRRNGGAFPNQLMWEIIDGRSLAAMGPHGTSQMPIWGQRFRQEALDSPLERAAPEWAVRNRIVALLDYLSRIQGS